MSSTYFNYTFYIQKNNDRSELAKLLNDNSIEESLQNIGFSDCFDEHESVEHLKLAGKGLSMYQLGRKVNVNLLVASKKFGCDFVHVHINYEESGEDLYYHRGQLVKKEHVDLLLRVYDPAILVSNNLQEQIDTRDLSALKTSIENGLDINAKFNEDPLLHEVYTNRPVFNFLLENGANPDAKDEYGYTLLMKLFESDERENADIALSLIEKGADVTLPMAEEEGGSLLWYAMKFNRKVVEEIKNHGGTFLRPDNTYEEDEKAFNASIAVEHHDIETLEKLLTEDWVNNDAIDELINDCISADNITALEMLIAKGYDLHNKNNDSSVIDLLESALSMQSLEMARYLINIAQTAKLDLSKLDDYASSEIVANRDATDILKILIPHAKSLLKEDADSTGLLNAIQTDAIENAKVLIKAGVKLDETSDKDFIIPLLADNIQEISGPMAQLLIDSGADPFLKFHKTEEYFESVEDPLNNGKSAIHLIFKDNKNKDPELFAVFNQLQNNLPVETQIWEVAEQGDLGSLERLLAKCSNKNITNKSGESLLQVAVRIGNQKMTSWLIQQGVDLNNIDSEGNTAVSNAVILENHQILKLLLDAGADANAKVVFPDNSDKLKESEEKEDSFMEVMGLSVENEIDKERERIASPVKITGDDANCLMLAANSGNLKLIQLLLINGAKIDAEDATGRTAIYFSAENGHLNCVKYLHLKGAKTEIHCKQKPQTHEFGGDFEMTFKDRHILEAAVYRGHIEICEYLVKICGIDINLKTKSTQLSAIISASLTGAFIEKDTITTLIELGADVNSELNDVSMGDASALQACAITFNAAGAKILLKHGANRDELNAYGDTAYDIAKNTLGENFAEGLGFDLEDLKPLKSSTTYRKILRKSTNFLIFPFLPSVVLVAVVYYFSETWAKYLAAGIALYWIWKIVKTIIKRNASVEIDEPETKVNPFASALVAIEKAVESNDKETQKDKETLAKWEEA